LGPVVSSSFLLTIVLRDNRSLAYLAANRKACVQTVSINKTCSNRFAGFGRGKRAQEEGGRRSMTWCRLSDKPCHCWPRRSYGIVQIHPLELRKFTLCQPIAKWRSRRGPRLVITRPSVLIIESVPLDTNMALRAHYEALPALSEAPHVSPCAHYEALCAHYEDDNEADRVAQRLWPAQAAPAGTPSAPARRSAPPWKPARRGPGAGPCSAPWPSARRGRWPRRRPSWSAPATPS